MPRDEKGRGRGDASVWVAICTDTELVPRWHVGPRDADAATCFMEDLEHMEGPVSGPGATISSAHISKMRDRNR